MGEPADSEGWPLRAWALAALGALVALAIHFLLKAPAEAHRLALATFLGVGGIAFAFTLERERIGWSALFAVVAGGVVGLALYWNGGPGRWDAGDGWRIACAALAVGIAAPLFQTARYEGRWRLPYAAVHDHAWTNTILWFAAWLFVGIVWLLAWLLAALFDLIGLDLLQKALRQAIVGRMLTGAALGGAIGLLRDRGRIVGTLQRVAMAALGVLAPVLGAGLLLFLLSLPFTGLAPLWQATKSTTPILLACVIGALILANAVLGDGPEEEARHPALRYGAMALGIAMLPLAAIAAVSVGLRVGQYGLTPSRLWALLFVGIACFYGLAYGAALVWKRRGWAGAVRPANLALAIGLCALALLLSTPLINFGALSTRDQVARLESGRIAPEKLDWAALAFDFGPAGKQALARLKAEGSTAAIRAKAADTLRRKSRWEVTDARDREDVARKIRVFPAGATLPPALRTRIAEVWQCRGDARCAVHLLPGGKEAALLWCGGGASGCYPGASLFQLRDGKWVEAGNAARPRNRLDKSKTLIESGRFEIRTITRRQIFLGDTPIGEPFE